MLVNQGLLIEEVGSVDNVNKKMAYMKVKISPNGMSFLKKFPPNFITDMSAQASLPTLVLPVPENFQDEGEASSAPQAVGQAVGSISTKSTNSLPDTWTPLDIRLYNALAELRRQVAIEGKVPAYIVFQNKVLQSLVEVRPTNDAAFLAVEGAGPAKLANFGASFMATIRSFCENNNLPPNQISTRTVKADEIIGRAVPASTNQPISMGQAHMKSFDDFVAGQTISEISASRGIKVSTVVQHLARALACIPPQNGDHIIFKCWSGFRIPDEVWHKISSALNGVPDGATCKLSIIKALLPEEINYDTIRICQLRFQIEQTLHESGDMPEANGIANHQNNLNM
jgi:hypothetical protein